MLIRSLNGYPDTWSRRGTCIGICRQPRESEYLDLVHDEDDALYRIIGASITYRLAFGSNAGKKASELVSKQSGFSLHGGVACKSNQRKKLERLCRYITRPAIAE